MRLPSHMTAFSVPSCKIRYSKDCRRRLAIRTTLSVTDSLCLVETGHNFSIQPSQFQCSDARHQLSIKLHDPCTMGVYPRQVGETAAFNTSFCDTGQCTCVIQVRAVQPLTMFNPGVCRGKLHTVDWSAPIRKGQRIPKVFHGGQSKAEERGSLSK